MRIAMIVPGTGLPYYCGNCMRDGSLPRALRKRGHEVACGFLYLPPARHPDCDDCGAPVFYGAISLFLGHMLHADGLPPRWLRRALDGRPLLRAAAALQGASDPGALGSLTLSMLRAEGGIQAEELDRLISWLSAGRPDIVHISNCLLLGMARRIRRDLGVPVACGLQDEDSWLDAMHPAHRAEAWEILKERSRDVDVFLPVSDFYAREMSRRLEVPGARMAVAFPGIDIEGFPDEPVPLSFDPPSIGFLSRMSDAMGLGVLVEAFALLCANGRHPGLRLRLAGGGTSADARCLSAHQRELSRRRLGGRLDVLPSASRQERVSFLRSLSVLSVPARRGEAFGTFLLEAMAAGVPVVQPSLGGFPEAIRETGGGVVYSPNTPEALGEALAGVLADPAGARSRGAAGFASVRSRFTAASVAERVERIFQDLVGTVKGRTA